MPRNRTFEFMMCYFSPKLMLVLPDPALKKNYFLPLEKIPLTDFALLRMSICKAPLGLQVYQYTVQCTRTDILPSIRRANA